MTGRVIQGCFSGAQYHPGGGYSASGGAFPGARAGPKLPVMQSGAAAAAPLAPLVAGPPARAFALHPVTAPGKGQGHNGAARTAQAKAATGAFRVDPAQLGLAGSGGRGLPDRVRGSMETALGADFSDVRVHIGPQAERIGAVAFTIGTDIYFAPGRFQPDTMQGRQLLGHELAHVVQQRQGRVRNPLGTGIAVVQDRALEAEADRLGHRAAIAATPQPAVRQRIAHAQGAGRMQAGGAPGRIGAMARGAVQPAGRAAGVIQRIGQEAFGYEVTATQKLQGLTSSQWAEELRKTEPLKNLVSVTPTLTATKWQELTSLTAILVMTIETLRLRESRWKAAKESRLSATLTTISDAQKVKKIKDALFGYDYPVPATNDLATLKTHPDVIELFEISPRLKREVDWVEPADRHATIMGHALGVDAPVRGASLESRTFDFETLKADPILKQQMSQNALSWAKSGSLDQIKTADGTVLITFYHKDEAFVQKVAPDAPSGIHRAVYSKRGKSAGPKNEYVKDDKGVFTRRYAYIEKNKYQFRDLANRQILEGRYPTQQSERSGAPQAYNVIDKFAGKQVRALPSAATFTDAYQLSYLHQELGSGHQQRGVSATSSPKHHIFSNAGESFRTKDGVRIEVDLARVRPGTNTAPQLINHYAASAREKMRPVIGTYSTKGRAFGHYQWSVKKNRELFIKEVRPEHISSLTLHETATGTSHREVRPTGFGPDDVATLGEQVGLAAYNAGFLAGSQGAPSNPGAHAAEKQKYYTEGHADGADYRTGYGHGGQKRRAGILLKNADKNNDRLKDDKQVRYTQGFWDGYHGRAMRRN